MNTARLRAETNNFICFWNRIKNTGLPNLFRPVSTPKAAFTMQVFGPYNPAKLALNVCRLATSYGCYILGTVEMAQV